MEEPDFWNDAERSTKLMKEAKNLKDAVEDFQKLETAYEEIGLMIEMGYEENDPELIPEIQGMLEEFTEKLDQMRISTLLTGEYDNCNAILRLNAGAGEPSPATGAACFTGCTAGGRTAGAFPQRCWTFWTVRRQG